MMALKKMIYLFSLFLVFLVFDHAHAAKISGYHFNDLDQNGIDDNEPRISGTEIVVRLKTDTRFVYHTTSDENGSFEFNKLPPGEYKICQNQDDSMNPTTPACIDAPLKRKNSFLHVRFGSQVVEDDTIQ